ncbi:hypothetical protein ACVWXM_009721 [Bradyrhizobium sp. GM7.3]
MAGDGEAVTRSLLEPGVWTGPACGDVSSMYVHICGAIAWTMFDRMVKIMSTSLTFPTISNGSAKTRVLLACSRSYQPRANRNPSVLRPAPPRHHVLQPHQKCTDCMVLYGLQLMVVGTCGRLNTQHFAADRRARGALSVGSRRKACARTSLAERAAAGSLSGPLASKSRKIGQGSMQPISLWSCLARRAVRHKISSPRAHSVSAVARDDTPHVCFESIFDSQRRRSPEDAARCSARKERLQPMAKHLSWQIRQDGCTLIMRTVNRNKHLV